MTDNDARLTGERYARYALLAVGLGCLTWGANWKVALGGYCLAAWAIAHGEATWTAVVDALKQKRDA